MKVIRIKKNGDMNELRLSIPKNPINILKKNSDSQGLGELKLLYSWIYNNETINCYSWYDGDAGFENKHELPPNGNSKFLEEDSSSILLFGDIFLLLFENNKCKDFTVSEYSLFYEDINEGFDDCSSNSEVESNFDTESEDEDYIYDENSDSEESLSNESLLDIDTNEY